MPGEKNGDPIEAMISSRTHRRESEPGTPENLADNPNTNEPREEKPRAAKREAYSPPLQPPKDVDFEGRLEVRPIGTPQGFRELAALHKRTWSNLNVQEKQVHVLLWPTAYHFGLYSIRPGSERRRPPLIGAFWARCLAESPLTLGHLYPPQLFKGLLATEVFEFGGMVIDPNYQGKGLVRLMSDTARIFVFSARPKLLITNPIEPLYQFYKMLGLRTVGKEPVEHPHAFNVKVWLMYGRFDEMSKPYFM